MLPGPPADWRWADSAARHVASGEVDYRSVAPSK